MGNIMRTSKPFVFSAQQSMIVPIMSKQNFSSYEMIERSTQKLNKALESEIKYENENYTQLEDIETFLNESGFTFSEHDDKLHMFLTKNVGDKHVEIAFEARQPLPDDMPEGEEN